MAKPQKPPNGHDWLNVELPVFSPTSTPRASRGSTRKVFLVPVAVDDAICRGATPIPISPVSAESWRNDARS